MLTRREIALRLQQSIGLGHFDRKIDEIDYSDIALDIRRYLLQERSLARHNIQWPCVPVFYENVEDEVNSIRTVPLDLGSNVEGTRSRDETFRPVSEYVSTAIDEGIPIWHISLPEARRTFFDGIVDTIYARSRSFWNSTPTSSSLTPQVTVTSSPGNQQARWTKGHFFSVGTVFGNTKHQQSVTPGIYCFWLWKDTPSPLMPLYQITNDTTVHL